MELRIECGSCLITPLMRETEASEVSVVPELTSLQGCSDVWGEEADVAVMLPSDNPTTFC